MTQQLLDRSQSSTPLQKGDKLLWLYNERDNRFGETIEVIRVRDGKVDYFFPDHPGWNTCLSPLDMFLPKRQYTLEEISRIRTKETRNRRWVRNCFVICIAIACIAQWVVLGGIREAINRNARIENGVLVGGE